MLCPLSKEDATVLAGASLFQYADMASLESYLEHCEEKALQTGEVLLSPNQGNQTIYILLCGRLHVYLDSPKAPPLNHVKPGECVGEISMIDHQRPSAFVVSAEPSRLLGFSQDTVWAMINASHMVSKNLLYILASRLRQGHGVLVDGLKLQTQLKQHAVIDGLTGLHNRRWFDDAMQCKVKYSNSNDSPLCLMLLDIDYFKKFNDEFGHLAGDQVIRAVAGALSASMRPDDMPARFGGDEFAVILPETGIDEALVIGERLRTHVQELSVRLGDQILPAVSVTLGVATMCKGDTVDSLFKRADESLYAAKKRGRNCLGCIQNTA